MKRAFFVAAAVAALLAVAAITVIAAPGGPGLGFGMMGRGGQGHMGEGWEGHMGSSGMMGGASMMHDDLEALLGVSHAEIHAAHVAGKSLVEIAAEKGISEADLTTALLDGRKAALDRAVEAGNLTREAADQMYRYMEDNIKAMINAKGMAAMPAMPGIGMHGGGSIMGGMHGDDAGSCHNGGAPAGSQSGTRNLMRLVPRWLQRG